MINHNIVEKVITRLLIIIIIISEHKKLPHSTHTHRIYNNLITNS
jgi:hypothetical protein